MKSLEKSMSTIQPLSIVRLVFISAVAIGLRYWLMFSKYQKNIANHIEISTPLNSWKRVSEGLFLFSKGINPYDGDLLHESPVSLYFYKTSLNIFGNKVETMFITFDILTGILLYFTVRKFLEEEHKHEERNRSDYSPDAKDYMLTALDVIKAPHYVTLAFFFNPYTLMNCVGMSTSVFFYFTLSIFLFSMVYGHLILGAVALALCTSKAFYPFVLIIPLSIYFANKFNSRLKAVVGIMVFIASLILIHVFCINFANDSKYLANVYGCILMVHDLQPNIGLFWYFFTEMFDHFRELFTYSFQINATLLYLIPLSIKYRKQPFLLTYAILYIICIFKSYPCVGDVGFIFSLLPCFLYLFTFCHQGFLVCAIFIITTALAPILWHLWIYCNSANANFYFGVTLAFAISQIFLITDVLFAQVKRDFYLIHSKERKVNGKEGYLALE